MTAIDHAGLVPNKEHWEIHPCSSCKDRELCAEKSLACDYYMRFINDKYKNGQHLTRIPREGLL